MSWNLKAILSYLKEALSNLSNYKILQKKQKYRKTIVIFEIGTLKFVNKSESLTHTVNFGIGSTFSKGSGSTISEGPGSLYKACRRIEHDTEAKNY